MACGSTHQVNPWLASPCLSRSTVGDLPHQLTPRERHAPHEALTPFDTQKRISMHTIPTNLSVDQAEQITELLLEAKKYLADAASPLQVYGPNYVGAVQKIGELLTELGVEAR